MIRCVRLWTGDDNNSHFDDGHIDMMPGARGDLLCGKAAATSISFQETASGGTFAWHVAPVRQFVITLSGTLEFQTRMASGSCCARVMCCSRRTPLAADTPGASPTISHGGEPM